MKISIAPTLKAKEEFEKFIGFLIPEVKNIDKSIGNPKPKGSLFRIYKDVRLSKNKDPYKTNFGAVLAKGGKKSPFKEEEFIKNNFGL